MFLVYQIEVNIMQNITSNNKTLKKNAFQHLMHNSDLISHAQCLCSILHEKQGFIPKLSNY